MFSIAGTVGDGRNMINMGVSWKFGQKNRIRVDTITMHKDGTLHIQRVRTIKERVDEKADPSSKNETKKKAKIKVAEKPME